jgi:hypothetical protein
MEIAGRDTLVICDSWAARRRQGALLPSLLDRVRALPGSRRPALAIVLASPAGATAPAALLSAGMAPVPQRLLPQPVAVIGGAMGAEPAPAWLRAAGLARWYITPYDWDVF